MINLVIENGHIEETDPMIERGHIEGIDPVRERGHIEEIDPMTENILMIADVLLA